ncbi:MAG TPA: nitroreductase [Clostridiales bacterium]|nr:nitroreductase [Clostridiales bacterium]
MEMMETILKRQSVRAFTEEQIKESELETILRAGYASPIGGAKFESMHFTVIQNADFLKRFRVSAAEFVQKPDANPLYGAPTFIVVSSNAVNPVAYANAGCVIENMCLAATELGLGSVYIYGCIAALNADQDLLKELGLPEGFTPVSGVILGYPAAPVQEREVPFGRIATKRFK